MVASAELYSTLAHLSLADAKQFEKSALRVAVLPLLFSMMLIGTLLMLNEAHTIFTKYTNPVPVATPPPEVFYFFVGLAIFAPAATTGAVVFAFGITRGLRRIGERYGNRNLRRTALIMWVPYVCAASPLLSYLGARSIVGRLRPSVQQAE